MNLADLIPELLSAIIDETVRSTDLKTGLSLRLVNRESSQEMDVANGLLTQQEACLTKRFCGPIL